MSDLQSFQQSFKGDVVTPSDADYTDAISRWAANAERNAQVVAFVKNAQDVALAIKYARQNKLDIAIKCGGHSAGGASSTEGLVIDLSRHMNTVRVDPEQKLAYIGGGALWAQVDKAAIEHELATVAGTVNDVRFLHIHLSSAEPYHSSDGRCGVSDSKLMTLFAF
jgi:FAD/FMN-containing dehydrogenase